MTPRENGGASGVVKLLGIILAMLGIIGGVYAMVEPQQKRVIVLELEMHALQETVNNLKTQQAAHETTPSHSIIGQRVSKNERDIEGIKHDIDKVTDVTNLTNAYDEQFMIIMWNKLFPESPMSAKDYWPFGDEGGS